MAYYQAPEPFYYSNEEVVDIRNPYSNARPNVTLTYNPTSGQFSSHSVHFTKDLKDFKVLTAELNKSLLKVNLSLRFPCAERKNNKHSDNSRG